MRKLFVLVGLVAAFAIPATALAVDLNPSHVGTTCADGGEFHFVANQTGGGSGTLSGEFSGSGTFGPLTPDKVNGGTNHWFVDGTGELLSATATVGGGLVLSDFECDEKK
jgi:hypothetical protein